MEKQTNKIDRNDILIEHFKKEARKETLDEFKKIIDRISDLNFTIPIKKRLKEEVNKLELQKSNGSKR